MKHLTVHAEFFSKSNGVIGNNIGITEMAKRIKVMSTDNRMKVPAIARWLRTTSDAYVTNLHTGEGFIVHFRRVNGKIDAFVASKAF